MKTNEETVIAPPSRWQRVLARLEAAMAVAAWCSYGPRTWQMDEYALRLLTERQPKRQSRKPAHQTRELALPVTGCCATCCG